MKVICQYCGNPAKLVGSAAIYGPFVKDYGLFYHCAKDKAWVGVHKNSPQHAPKGTLANAELRRWRQNAHNLFDVCWQSGKVTRKKAYVLLQNLMDMTPDEAHIGLFDIEQCKKLVTIIRSDPSWQTKSTRTSASE
jgi:hypothetical protein